MGRKKKSELSVGEIVNKGIARRRAEIESGYSKEDKEVKEYLTSVFCDFYLGSILQRRIQAVSTVVADISAFIKYPATMDGEFRKIGKGEFRSYDPKTLLLVHKIESLILEIYPELGDMAAVDLKDSD